VVVATGSKPLRPPIPGIEHALDSTGILALRKVPPRLLVIGGGTIALEFASIFGNVGSKVTVLETRPAVLADLDDDLRKAVERASSRSNVEIRTRVKVVRVDVGPKNLSVTVETGRGKEVHEAEVVLVATGRGPRVEGLGLERIGVRVEGKGVSVDEYLETDAPGVYAAGDVHGSFQLTPVASYEGDLAARNALGGRRTGVDYRVVPRTVFTIPSASSVGLSEKEARARGIDCASSLLPFGDIGAGLTAGETEGFVKIVFDKRTREVAGAHIFGAESEELIHLPTLAMKARLKAEKIVDTLTIHPSLAEAFFGAASKAKLARKSSRRAS